MHADTPAGGRRRLLVLEGVEALASLGGRSVAFAKEQHREGLIGSLGVEFPHEGVESAPRLQDVAARSTADLFA